MDGWKTSFLLGWPISGVFAVSFREGDLQVQLSSEKMYGKIPAVWSIKTPSTNLPNLISCGIYFDIGPRFLRELQQAPPSLGEYHRNHEQTNKTCEGFLDFLQNFGGSTSPPTVDGRNPANQMIW